MPDPKTVLAVVTMKLDGLQPRQRSRLLDRSVQFATLYLVVQYLTVERHTLHLAA